MEMWSVLEDWLAFDALDEEQRDAVDSLPGQLASSCLSEFFTQPPGVLRYLLCDIVHITYH